MSQTVRDAKEFISLLAKSKRGKQRALIRIASKGEILAIKELLVNLLHGNIPLTPDQRAALEKYKYKLRTLAQKHLSKAKLLLYLTVISKVLSCIVPFLVAL